MRLDRPRRSGPIVAPDRPSVLRRLTPVLALLVALTGSLAAGGGSAAQADDSASLYLVTLRGPGTAGELGFLPRALREVPLLARQDESLADLGAPEPIYRWTTALNGYAVELSDAQVELLQSSPDVASVERNTVRPLTGTLDSASGPLRDSHGSGGAGVVIGLVDTGLAPESPLFAQVRHRGRSSDFSGACDTATDWDASECNGKIVGAHWFVDGFGSSRVRAAASLSPRDTDGHGTQMASIAAGDADVPVRLGDEDLGTYSGVAPEAQLAIYKACWSAPDPRDDGCATADLVTAIDQATADGVDVLSLSVGGPAQFDTVEHALLGATEAGVVVTAAAGNTNMSRSLAHPSPWVTTVGATIGDLRRGQVVLPDGPRLNGAMLSQRTVGPARVVLAEDVPAADASLAQARVCAPGSLDAARVVDAVVVCQRGRVGRVDKSEAVALADGVAMVLVNARRGSVDADAHAVPTVHLNSGPARRLLTWIGEHPDARITLESTGIAQRRPRVAPYSPSGEPGTGVLKPDVLAPGTGVLGAVPAGRVDAWDFVTGTSAAAAYAAGAAAALLSRPGRTAADVRSSLVTTAAPIKGAAALSAGAGRVRLESARSPGLAYLIAPRDYRSWLEGELSVLNTPSAMLTGATTTFRREVTNVGTRPATFTASTRGFRADVTVFPTFLELAPGESATFRVTLQRRGSRVDGGSVTWRGSDGSATRIPVVLGR